MRWLLFSLQWMNKILIESQFIVRLIFRSFNELRSKGWKQWVSRVLDSFAANRMFIYQTLSIISKFASKAKPRKQMKLRMRLPSYKVAQTRIKEAPRWQNKFCWSANGGSLAKPRLLLSHQHRHVIHIDLRPPRSTDRMILCIFPKCIEEGWD